VLPAELSLPEETMAKLAFDTGGTFTDFALLDDDGELPEAIYWDDETTSSAGGAFANVIAAAVEALLKAQGAKAVRS